MYRSVSAGYLRSHNRHSARRISVGVGPSFHFQAAACDCQDVHGHISRIAVNPELEPLGKEGLQHKFPRVRTQRAGFFRFADNVVPFRLRPFWAADDLTIIDVIRIAGQVF